MTRRTLRGVLLRAQKKRITLLSRSVLITVLTVLGAVFFIAPGLWAFFGPRSFFDELATFEPYNVHFLHDIGAFQLGIGAALAAALWRRSDAIFAALAGAGVGSAFHTVAHLRDHDLGGQDSDSFVFGITTVLLLAGAAWQLRGRRN